MDILHKDLENKELDKCIGKALMGNGPNDDTVSFDAEESAEATYNKKVSMGLGQISTTIDIDNAKWNQDYAKRLENNLNCFKKLGLYEQLQNMGIIYNVNNFKRSYAIMGVAGGTQKQWVNKSDMSYDSVEKQFDEIDKEFDKMNTNKTKGRSVS